MFSRGPEVAGGHPPRVGEGSCSSGTVTLLRVVAVDLIARLTDLLHHDELLVRLDYPLDARYDAIRYHQEAVSLGKDRLVDPRVQVDLLQTRRLCALAVKRHHRANTVKLRALLYPAVDVPDELFVPRGAPSEVHVRANPGSAKPHETGWLRLSHAAYEDSRAHERATF
jgi:hypothetical protein